MSTRALATLNSLVLLGGLLTATAGAAPGFHQSGQVKVLHFDALRVAEGDRVEGGVTVVGSAARRLLSPAALLSRRG